jgi:sigma-54 dependent transcriptional regulator, acetoin dehydrogenase operon transcriptional activator AcoR
VADPRATLPEQILDRRAPHKVVPHLELALECERPHAGPARYRLSELKRVRLGRGVERDFRVADDGCLDIVVPDAWMSSRHAELARGTDGWMLTDLHSRNGTRVNGARVPGGVTAGVADGDLWQLGHTFFRFLTGPQENGPPLREARDVEGAAVSWSPRFADIVAKANAVATTRVPVLLHGESGTGKEILARSIHARSGRPGAFAAVNCGAIPSELVESELFGHSKGAFSGAHQEKSGLVRAAHGGTLFLDEIGDLGLPAQAALLRVLQESEVLPVGATRPISVDLRLITATHRDLDALVKQGAFRHDLLARIDGVRLDLPPLRDRPEDVPLLIACLVRKLAPGRVDVSLQPDAAQALLEHEWPLNVRELEQALAGALALSAGGPIELAHLPRALRADDGPTAPRRELTTEEQRHREELSALLTRHRGNLSAVAREIGKGRTQVVRWIERYGLDAAAYRD